MSAASISIEALPIADVEDKIMLGPKLKRSWDFINQQGKPTSGCEWYTEPTYNGQPFVFVLDKVKSFRGIQVNKQNPKKGFMSLVTKKDLADDIRKYVDATLKNALLRHAVALDIKGAKTLTMEKLEMIYKSVIAEGKEKEGKPGEKWDDQFIANVDLKKVQQQWVLDKCDVEDPSGTPYAYTSLDGLLLEEVSVEVEKIVIKASELCVKLKLRKILVDAKPVPKINTKRRIDQTKIDTAVSTPAGAEPPRAAPAAVAEPAVPSSKVEPAVATSSAAEERPNAAKKPKI
jgi:hypothetical protein